MTNNIKDMIIFLLGFSGPVFVISLTLMLVIMTNSIWRPWVISSRRYIAFRIALRKQGIRYLGTNRRSF